MKIHADDYTKWQETQNADSVHSKSLPTGFCCFLQSPESPKNKITLGT